jgi:hypothetical protein
MSHQAKMVDQKLMLVLFSPLTSSTQELLFEEIVSKEMSWERNMLSSLDLYLGELGGRCDDK